MKHILNEFTSSFRNSPEKVVITDDMQNVVWMNTSFREFIDHLNSEYEENIELISLRLLLEQYLHEDELMIHDILTGVKNCSKNKKACFTYEFPLYTNTKSYWMMLTACSQEFEDREINIIKIYDITAQHKKRKLENNRDDNVIVKQIITESMHTWRQPLNSISLFTQDIKEQFNDSSLTKYYMNFATRQIFNEIQRLSDSIDEMAAFYANDTDEEIINVAECMFVNIETIDAILKKNHTKVQLNCHALGNLQSSSYIAITDNFSIRCGTGTKKCFHGCNKGNVVIIGDKQQYQFIIRKLITIGLRQNPETEKTISFEHLIIDNKLLVKIDYSFLPENIENELEILKSMFDHNFKGSLDYTITNFSFNVTLSLEEYKTKSPI